MPFPQSHRDAPLCNLGVWLLTFDIWRVGRAPKYPAEKGPRHAGVFRKFPIPTQLLTNLLKFTGKIIRLFVRKILTGRAPANAEGLSGQRLASQPCAEA